MKNYILKTIVIITMALFCFACNYDGAIPVAVTGVSINDATVAMELEVGQTCTMTVAVTPEDATNKNVNWVSIPESVATVDQGGVVTAISAGTAIIIVTTEDGGKTASRRVVVSDIPIYNIILKGVNGAVEADKIEAAEGETVTITATPDDNYEFTQWVVTSGGAILASATDAQTTFIMPAEDVEIEAQFEEIVAGVLINGVVWAMRNVAEFGTFVANPEDYGCFYQWNRPTAWPATGSANGWNQYYPEGTTWEADNDPCPDGWHVPTLAECETLFDENKVDFGEISLGDYKYGFEFKDRDTGSTVLLPSAGYRYISNGTVMGQDTSGYYWSSTYHTSVNNAHNITFSWRACGMGSFTTSYGCTVRCVAD